MGGCHSSAASQQIPTPVGEQKPSVQFRGVSPHGLPSRVKLVLLGDSGVGKSCLALRYVKGTFDPANRITVGAAFLTHTVQLPDGNSLKLEIWDTAGQERYQSLAPLYYRGAHAAAVVYSINSRESFVKAQFWVEQLNKNAGDNIVIMLVGNKTDLQAEERQVEESEGQALADRLGMLFIETSAKTAAHVADMFENIARRLVGGLPVSSHAKVVV